MNVINVFGMTCAFEVLIKNCSDKKFKIVYKPQCRMFISYDMCAVAKTQINPRILEVRSAFAERFRGGSRRISEGVDLIIYYCTYSTYSDRQAWANSVDPDQTPQNAASDQGLHCLSLTQQFYKHSQVIKIDFWREVYGKSAQNLSNLSKISHENETLSQTGIRLNLTFTTGFCFWDNFNNLYI